MSQLQGGGKVQQDAPEILRSVSLDDLSARERCYERHLFISYAHLDNEPLQPGQMGWVTRLHESLKTFLAMRLGKKPDIWRDEKLRGNDIFGQEILDQFPKTALLLSVVTPRYLESDWCNREVTKFCDAALLTGGTVIDNKARVFKVIKTPVDTHDSLHPVVQDALGYDFFVFEDGAPLELDPAFGDKFVQEYNRKVGKLAWDITQLLKKLQPASDTAAASDVSAPHKPVVYLAECSYDRRQDRERLEADLKHHGYTVLPDRLLPREEPEYVAEVGRLLERCTLSIHLIGEFYGAVPDGPSQKSVAVLQNEVAAAACRTRALRRLIWLPEGTSPRQDAQKKFIDSLHGDPEFQCGADLITGDLEIFKTSVHGTLKKLEEPPPQKSAEQAGKDHARQIHIICDVGDRKATVPLRKFLKTKGFDVSLPAFEGNATAVREANLLLLTNCDAVIVFYGAGDEAWRLTIDSGLKKMRGYRAGKPFIRFTYLADPRTSDKEDLLEMAEPGLIDGLGGFSEGALDEFVRALEDAST
jgi:hypothetical protein